MHGHEAIGSDADELVVALAGGVADLVLGAIEVGHFANEHHAHAAGTPHLNACGKFHRESKIRGIFGNGYKVVDDALEMADLLVCQADIDRSGKSSTVDGVFTVEGRAAWQSSNDTVDPFVFEGHGGNKATKQMVQRLGRSCCTDCVLLVNLRGARDGEAFGINLCAGGNGEL